MKRGLKEFQKLYALACESSGLALDLAQDLCFRLDGAKNKSVQPEDIHIAYGLSGMGEKYNIPLMDQVHKLAKVLGYTSEDYIENMRQISRKQAQKNKVWSEIVKAKLKLEPWCELCGSTFNLAGHHVKRRSQGGENTPYNCQILCVSCHRNLHDGVI